MRKRFYFYSFLVQAFCGKDEKKNDILSIHKCNKVARFFHNLFFFSLFVFVEQLHIESIYFVGTKQTDMCIRFVIAKLEKKTTAVHTCSVFMFGLSWVIHDGEKHCLGAKWKSCWRLRMNLSWSMYRLFWLETGELSKLNLKKVCIANGLSTWWNMKLCVLSNERNWIPFYILDGEFDVQSVACVVIIIIFFPFIAYANQGGFLKSKCFQFIAGCNM